MTDDVTPREATRRSQAKLAVRGIVPRADVRPELDFYRTPPVATWGLLQVEEVRGRVWEPACGDGAISRVLEARGCDVVSTDLVDRGYGTPGADFLVCAPPGRVDAIVTNPPFTHMRQFVERARDLAAHGWVGKTCMIGRLLFLEGRDKARILGSAGLARVWILNKRISIAPMRNADRECADGTGGMIAFAWYVFERGYAGAPSVGWIDVNRVLGEMRARGELPPAPNRGIRGT